jgi:hypothetical protein
LATISHIPSLSTSRKRKPTSSAFDMSIDFRQTGFHWLYGLPNALTIVNALRVVVSEFDESRFAGSVQNPELKVDCRISVG